MKGKASISIPTSSTLTRRLMLSGLSRTQSSAIASLFLTWCHRSGPEWTNSRWKDLRQWYEMYLAADRDAAAVTPPPYFRVNRHGLPYGCLNAIFKLRPDKALLALSINTLLVATGQLASQQQKFLQGLQGNGVAYTPALREKLMADFTEVRIPRKLRTRTFNGEFRLPVLADLNGKATIPAGKRTLKLQKPTSDKPTHKGKPRQVESRKTLNAREKSVQAAEALVEAWKTVPAVTAEFLEDSGHLDYIPWDVLAPGGYRFDPHFEDTIGVVGHIQEPELKARNIHNTHLVTQVTLEPLGKLWYGMLRKIGYNLDGEITQDWGRDCFANQTSGVAWVQQQLRSGIELAGADLSSATDLLSLDACLDIVNQVFFPNLLGDAEYMRHVQYFRDCSRAPVWDPVEGSHVKWEQGQPLGLYPSFALLGLTNNALCILACKKAGLPTNSYCVLGDDTIMDARASEYYLELVTSIGGEVNLSKTLTSKHIAEFAGRVVTPSDVIRKRVKFSQRGVSDDSFMEFMRTAGPLGLSLLRPRQRRLWRQFRFVPGIVVPGPWNLDSCGEPLSSRYEWYLTFVRSDGLLPDPETPSDAGFDQYLIAALLGQGSMTGDLPSPIDDLTYKVSLSDKVQTGDPRKWLVKGKSFLSLLESKAKDKYFLSYEEFRAREIASLSERAVTSAPADVVSL